MTLLTGIVSKLTKMWISFVFVFSTWIFLLVITLEKGKLSFLGNFDQTHGLKVKHFSEIRRIELSNISTSRLLKETMSIQASKGLALTQQQRQDRIFMKGNSTNIKRAKSICSGNMADMNYNLDSLLKLLQDPPGKVYYKWIRGRVSSLWSCWVQAARSMSRKYDVSNRKRLKIHLHLGLLSLKGFAEGAFKGGPLGELVQWADIISSLQILGHEVTFSMDQRQFVKLMQKQWANDTCNRSVPIPSGVDVLYTDYIGLKMMKRSNHYGQLHCRIRVIDSFGTEPAFNYDKYAKLKKLTTPWAMQNLNPQQVFTMFPHSPDNSFMGFVIGSQEEVMKTTTEKKNWAVVYGKDLRMWKDKWKYVDVFHQYLEIHATVADEAGAKTAIPPYVVNHGLLKGPQVQELLKQAKVFIGLGFPVEGPAPLEAILQGAVFINAQFQTPLDRINYPFFKGKPTSRQLTSQHPYAEIHIGQPHVETVNLDRPEEIHAAMKRILALHNSSQFTGYLPNEYSYEGMLQRVSVYLQHQDFCNAGSPQWPPADQVKFYMGVGGQSCQHVCSSRHRTCERSFFQELNNKSMLEQYYGEQCRTFETMADIFYPAVNVNTRQCILQQQPLLFSCVGSDKNMARLCPCRTFIRGQWALCNTCELPLLSRTNSFAYL